MIRRAFFAVASLSVAVLGLDVTCRLGPVIQEHLWPIRAAQRMEHVTRTDDRICWEWISVKLQPAVSDNLDLFIDMPTDHAVGAPFERDTGMPWARSRAVGLGPHRQPYCVLLPPGVRPADPVRITQVIDYPGWLGLWHVKVRMPDVESAGTLLP